MSFDAHDLDELIAGLGKARQRLADEVAVEIDPNAIVEPIVSPSLSVRKTGNNPQLLVRDPRYGLLSFELPPLLAHRTGLTLVALAGPPGGS